MNMLTLEQQKVSDHVFSRPKIELILVKYTEHTSAIIWISYLIWEIFENFQINYPRVSITFLLPLFIIVILFSYLVFYKFAYEIIFNYDKNQVTFNMFKKKPIIVKFEDVDKILMSLYIIFYCNGKSVYYNGYDDNNFIKFINESNFPIEKAAGSKFLEGRWRKGGKGDGGKKIDNSS